MLVICLNYKMPCVVKNDFGGIDVLEFSPYAGPETFRHVLETTPESVMNKYTATYCQLSNL